MDQCMQDWTSKLVTTKTICSFQIQKCPRAEQIIKAWNKSDVPICIRFNLQPLISTSYAVWHVAGSYLIQTSRQIINATTSNSQLMSDSASWVVRGSLRTPESGSLRTPKDHLEHQKVDHLVEHQGLWRLFKYDDIISKYPFMPLGIWGPGQGTRSGV